MTLLINPISNKNLSTGLSRPIQFGKKGNKTPDSSSISRQPKPKNTIPKTSPKTFQWLKNKVPHKIKHPLNKLLVKLKIKSKSTLETPPVTTSTAPETVYSFGTSGYRNDTEEGFNQAVVLQITNAISNYLIDEQQKTGDTQPVLVGGDTREKTKRFIPVIAELLKSHGLDVKVSDSDIPSPVLAYAAKYFNEIDPTVKETLGAILMTASHNPWNYGGYNFLTPDAAVAPSEVSKQFVENQKAPRELNTGRDGSISTFNGYEIYKNHLKNGIKIDYQKIKDSGLDIYYDPLYATGRQYFSRLLSEEGVNITSINDSEERPSGYTGMPEPSASNLTELSKLVKNSDKGLKVGFANDGDADRFGVLDENGNFVNPNDILALTMYHLIHNKKEAGVVTRSQATTHFLDALADKHNFDVVQTPVGYKYIAEEFIERDEKGETPVLIGGESSGGVSVKGHIPEKDGILANLLIAELIATEGKPLSEIIKSLKDKVTDKFIFRELSITTEAKDDILKAFQSKVQTGGNIAGITIDTAKSQAEVARLEKLYHTKDGAKLYLDDKSWVLVRASGTEPMLRVYVEAVADTESNANAKADKIQTEIIGQLTRDYGVDATKIKQKL